MSYVIKVIGFNIKYTITECPTFLVHWFIRLIPRC